jgi:hypothetical protein
MPSATLPTEIPFCRMMQDSATAKAFARFMENGATDATGAHLEVTADGFLVCTAQRTDRGLYRPVWSLNDARISRLEAEKVVRRHLAQMEAA